MSEESIQEEDRDKKFERRLTAIDLTSRQKDFFRAVKRARSSDDWAIIGSWINPPMTAGAARNMMYRLKRDYRSKKRFTNLYEEIVRVMGKKEIEVI